MYRVVVDLLQPYTLGWLLTIAVFVYLWARNREVRPRLLLLGTPLVLLLLLSLPAVAHLALGSLEWQHPPLAEMPDDADHIVVLSGGIYPPSPVRPEPEVGDDTLQRCLHALELYRRRPCKLVLSGGYCEPACPEVSLAAVMRDFFREHGVPDSDLILETFSKTTYENAVGSRQLLEPQGVQRIILVTEATHMVRSVRAFQRQGFEVTPAPCHYQVGAFAWSLQTFLPNPLAATRTQAACHEWLGTVWYWCNGRI